MSRQELTKLDRTIWIALIITAVAFWAGVIWYGWQAWGAVL